VGSGGRSGGDAAVSRTFQRAYTSVSFIKRVLTLEMHRSRGEGEEKEEEEEEVEAAAAGLHKSML